MRESKESEDDAGECICGFLPAEVLGTDHNPECEYHECGEDVCCCQRDAQ